MKARSRLKHSAAGLLGSLISRNNDVNGYWAPGLLYRDVSAPPHVVELDLLSGWSKPANQTAGFVTASSAMFLRSALEKQGVDWDELTLATIKFQFNAEVPDPHFQCGCAGDPFICTVALHTVEGLAVIVSARARCLPYRPGIYSQREVP